MDNKLNLEEFEKKIADIEKMIDDEMLNKLTDEEIENYINLILKVKMRLEVLKKIS